MSPHPEAARLVDLLTARGFTVATAETDTGGSIGAAIVDVPGASAVFPGGVTAYANHPKRSLLDIPEALLHHYGAVSEQAVDAMARGARRAFASDIALANPASPAPAAATPAAPSAQSGSSVSVPATVASPNTTAGPTTATATRPPRSTAPCACSAKPPRVRAPLPPADGAPAPRAGW